MCSLHAALCFADVAAVIIFSSTLISTQGWWRIAPMEIAGIPRFD
jgi:hypothetical protein